MPPDLVPPSRPGRDDRSRESRPAERARAMRHAHPVGASGRRVVRAGLQDPLAQAVGRTDLRQRAIRGRTAAAPAASPRRPELTQAFVPRDRVQPGTELVRIAEPLELGGGDDKGVRHGVGRLTRRVRVGQHEPAVGVQRRRVTVVRLGEPVRVTGDDGRDQLTVLHGPNRSWPPHSGESERHNQIAEKRTKDSYGINDARPAPRTMPGGAPATELSCTRRPGRTGDQDRRRRRRAGAEDGTGSRTARWCPPRPRT